MATTIAQEMSPSRRFVLPTLCLTAFISTLNIDAAAPFFPAMSDDFGVSVALLGQVAAAMMVISAVLALVAGPLADRYGVRRFMILGLVATAIAFADYGLAPVVWLLIVASIAGAIGEATVPGLTMAIAGTEFDGPGARRAMSMTVGAMASAPIIGIPMMALIGDVIGWRAAFLLIAAVTIVVGLMARFTLPEVRPTTTGSLRWGQILDAYRPLVRDHTMRMMLGSTLLRSLCWIGLLTYFGAFLHARYGLSTGEIGVAYMVVGLGYVGGSVVVGSAFTRVPDRALVVVGNSTMALLMLVAFTSALSLSVTVALCALAAFTAAIGFVALANVLTSETPAGSGTTMVLNIALFDFGAALGTSLGGALLSTGGFGAIGVGLSLLGFASAALVIFSRHRRVEPGLTPLA